MIVGVSVSSDNDFQRDLKNQKKYVRFSEITNSPVICLTEGSQIEHSSDNTSSSEGALFSDRPN
jgi:hypothetical protein